MSLFTLTHRLPYAILTGALLSLFAQSTSAQTNNTFVQLSPASGDVCYGMDAALSISGNSFTPVSYLWSDGSTAASIQLNTSGTYTVTVAGYRGSSNRLVTLTRTRTYSVLARPELSVERGPWVCKGDTVMLASTPGYPSYAWSDGSTAANFSKTMNTVTNGAVLDTATVYYTASIPGLCSAKSEEIVIRSIRLPKLGSSFCSRSDYTPSDSARIELVIPYLYPVTFDVEFVQVSDPSRILAQQVTNPRRWVSLNGLTPGEQYEVRTRPVINGVPYCWGDVCTIGLSTPGSKNGTVIKAEINQYTFYSIDGRYMGEVDASQFDTVWFRTQLPKGTYVIIGSGPQGIAERKVMNNFDY
ncbi:MAG: hypothetical protein ACK5CT_00800 [Bacteroidota bacterium]|jgi:hypothetical protein